MKCCLQWTQQNPTDWIELDSSAWESLAKRPVPDVGELGGVDDTPGWVFDLNIQGYQFAGADHYAVEDVGGGGVRVTVWNDDAGDILPDEFFAEVWTLMPLAADANLGGAINTVQSRVVYAAPTAFAKWTKYPIENTTVKPWSEFVAPDAAVTRHGIWATDVLAGTHEKAVTEQGWRDFGQHLDPSELDENGRVKSQRLQKRYKIPPGTLTFFLYDNVLANGIHTADHEFDADETDIAVQSGQTATIAAGATEQAHVWVTVANKPNSADWPNGVYRVQIDVQTAMNAQGYGFLTINSVAGHMARVNSGISSDLQSWEQDEIAFTGTGIKLGTNTIDPGSGGVTDRYEALLVFENSSGTMEGTLTVRCDDSDSFMDGPWVSGPTDLPLTLADDINA